MAAYANAMYFLLVHVYTTFKLACSTTAMQEGTDAVQVQYNAIQSMTSAKYKDRKQGRTASQHDADQGVSLLQ